MQSSSGQPSPPAGVLSTVVGDTSRTRVLEYLASQDEPTLQCEIAEYLGVSEASVSRAKEPLIDAGVVEETEDGLQAVDGIDDAIEQFERALR